MSDQLVIPAPNSWGVFTQAGKPALDVDSTVSLKFNNSVKVSNFPVEQGGFATYNKVNNPFGFKVRVVVSGSVARRTALLDAVAAMLDGITLYNVVMPEKTYLNVTLKDYDFSREAARGQQLIAVDLSFEQVREVIPQFTTVTLPAAKVKNPSTASKVGIGKCHSDPAPLTLQNTDPRTLAHIQVYGRPPS